MSLNTVITTYLVYCRPSGAGFQFNGEAKP